jgi:YggT family protein
MASVIILLLNLVILLLIVRAILSWFPIGFDSPMRPIVDLIYRITEPVLAPIRGILPSMGGLDLSVLLLILAIQIVVKPLVGAAL